MPTQPAALTVLMRDDTLLIVAKPSGLLVHNGWARESVTALSLARALVGVHVYPIHRLDRSCSGVLMFGLSSQSAHSLQQVLADASTTKRYLALVRGIPPDSGVIDHPLAKVRGAEKRAATTHYRRLGSFERYSLLEATPLTGRLHQIRRHMKHISHPIIGDVRYGKREHNHHLRDRFGLGRLALHALSLHFTHPRSGDRLEVTAALPSDLAEPLSAMGLGACFARTWRLL